MKKIKMKCFSFGVQIMINHFLKLYLMIFIACNNGRDLKSIEKIHEDKKPDSLIEMKTYYPSGELHELFYVRNNKKDSIDIEYYKSGKIKFISCYSMGELNGLIQSFFENGDTSYKGQCKNSKFVGLHKQYYSNKQTMVEVLYDSVGHYININAWDSLSNQVIINGNGSLLLYYPIGKKHYMASYLNSKLHGSQITWYPNGQIYSRTNYDSGIQQGDEEIFLDDGRKWIKGDDPTNPRPSSPR